VKRTIQKPRRLCIEQLELRCCLSVVANSQDVPTAEENSAAANMDRLSAAAISSLALGEEVSAASQQDPPVDLASFQRPAPGTISRNGAFGPRRTNVEGASRFHRAVDIGGNENKLIRASSAGEVIFLNRNPKNSNFGKYIIIDHGLDDQGRRIYTLYAHASKIIPGVTLGSHVNQGQAIARVGDTSNSLKINPHLHFEVRRGSATAPTTFAEWRNQTTAINPRFTGAFKSVRDTKALLIQEDTQFQAKQFNGVYVGSYTGIVTASGISSTVNGSVRFLVRSRKITVVEPANGGGTVSPTGNGQFAAASGSVAGARFGGKFELQIDGSIHSAGGWSYQQRGASGLGTWSATVVK
jgi:murein DD-endopeptidase MepM/ murein hydrolase activator NlpD